MPLRFSLRWPACWRRLLLQVIVFGVLAARSPLLAEPDFSHPWDPAAALPQFITHAYVDPSYLTAISKYRSNAGHSFSDNYEPTNRSLKNYFEPHIIYLNGRNQIPVFAPATGTIASIVPEGQTLSNGETRGNQLSLSPDGFPAFEIRLFHVGVSSSVHAGSHVNAGDPLGFVDLRESVDFDWAVGAAWNATPLYGDAGQVLKAPGYRLLSPFDFTTDAVLAQYAAYGVTDRNSLVVSLDYRAAHPDFAGSQDIYHFDPAEYRILLASPDITFQPTGQYVSQLGSAIFLTSASAQGAPVTYQWNHNGVPIVGAVGAQTNVLNLSNVTAADVGYYSATITANGRSIQSAIAILAVADPGPSRLINVSTRGFVPLAGALTPGFVLRGTGTKGMVIRGVGPTLGSYFGLGGTLADPKLDIIPQGGATPLFSNDNWSASATLDAATVAVGAFPLAAGSKDAAVLGGIGSPGTAAYTVRISPTGSATSGIALAEAYDMDSLTAPTRLVNVSTLGYAGTGDQALILGFVIGGTSSKQVLIRAVGPGLTSLGVGGVLPDPQITVTPIGQSFTVASNAGNWSLDGNLAALMVRVGAFALNPGAKDAALSIRLLPGGYSVVATSLSNTTGNVLLEVYDADP